MPIRYMAKHAQLTEALHAGIVAIIYFAGLCNNSDIENPNMLRSKNMILFKMKSSLFCM